MYVSYVHVAVAVPTPGDTITKPAKKPVSSRQDIYAGNRGQAHSLTIEIVVGFLHSSPRSIWGYQKYVQVA